MSETITPKLSREEALTLKNRRTGIAIFQGTWILVFVSLSVIYFLIRSNFATWPPEGATPLTGLVPTIATALIAVSGWTVRTALRNIQNQQRDTFSRFWLVTLALGVAFVGLIGWQWLTIVIPNSDARQYGLIARSMLGYHVLHTVVIGAYMFSVWRNAPSYGRRKGNQATHLDFWPVEAGANLWYFVVAAWLLFYIVLYLV
jgi:cytochrome c oxidase subunit III